MLPLIANVQKNMDRAYVASENSAGACTEAERPDTTPVGLMNGEQLVDLLIEHEIGVKREIMDLIQLNESDPSEAS